MYLTFEQRIASYREFLIAFALKWGLGHPDAEDSAHDAILKALQKKHMYQPQNGAELKTWLVTLWKNIQINKYRKSKNQEKYIDEYTRFAQKQERNQLLPDEYTEVKDKVTEILKKIKQLPKDYEEMFILRIFEGMTYPELAEILDIPLGTIKSRLHRVRKDLLLKY